MLNNQDFMELGLRNEVGSLDVKDQGISERARNDEERLINGLKWTYDYFEVPQTDIHHQIVPEIHKEDDEEEEVSKKDLLVVVPDEHSETGDHHHQYHSSDYSDSSDSLRYFINKHQKPKRRRVQISSDEESEGFTREVPSVTQKVSKRRRDEMMSNKMRTLQQLVPNCHKMDSVSVLDKAIEYMKNLQLQLQVMSMMGMNVPYIPPATLDFRMHHHLLTAMVMTQGQNLANQTMFPPSIPASNWLLPPYSNLSFPYTTNPSLLPSSSASSPQCLCSLVPRFPRFPNFSSFTMGRP